MSQPAAENRYEQELAAEQAYVSELFARIDGEVQQASASLKEVMLRVDTANPDPEDLVRREHDYHLLNEKLDKLTLAQLGLVFGRIDVACADPETTVPGRPDLERRYIGRMGIDDRADNYRTLLIDWRAPMARAFYLATTAQPEGVEVRRHIRTLGRKVTAIHDEHLTGNAATGQLAGATNIGGETALLEALDKARGAHMNSIVETIQREQDQIIRDATRGVMVVEGGPGTGKTAVALHRVAYLLYTWREQLEKTGVLIIGPNDKFLDYISRVLPELGETGVVPTTVGNLYPGVRPVATDSLLSQEVKGSLEMIHILTAAIRFFQQVPAEPISVQVDGITLTIEPKLVAAARTRARRSRQPHNQAQAVFIDKFMELCAKQQAEIIGADPLGGANLLSAADVFDLQEELAENLQLKELATSFWPQLEPKAVLAQLYSDEELLSAATIEYDEETKQALARPNGQAWTSADAALLDELYTLLGPTETDLGQNQEVDEELLAEDALDTLASSEATDNDDEFDSEILSAGDVIDASHLAERQQARDERTTAERAQADLDWAYGHIIIDEAQELSAMEWRMVMRRSPNRWMTIVGDPAQTGSPAGVESWAEALEPYVKNRFKLHQLTVNYRTPAAIMELANSLLPQVAPEQQPATSIRDVPNAVHYHPACTDPEQLAATLQQQDPNRSVTVISAANVTAAKGLEFDYVIVVNPAEIVAASPQGWQDLFVALSRATQQLHLLGPLPTVLDQQEI